jgi:hypothetical protein
MNNLSKKIIAFFLIMLISVSFLPKSALAEFNWAAPPDAASQALDGVFAKYRAKTSTVVEMVDKMNNLQLKTPAPEATIIFSPTNPNPGEKVTATATVSSMFIENNRDPMYYTWYLKHTGEADTVKNLDDVFKVRAMKIITSDGYENDGTKPYINNSGYKAIFGGDNQKGKSNHCFFSDVSSGKQYEFNECKHLFPNAPGAVTGDGTFTENEENFWSTDPSNPDTAGRGHTDEANVVGLGANAFTWTYQEGDQIGVAVEGISIEPTSYDDSSYKIMWALTKNKCDISSEDDSFSSPGDPTDTVASIDPLQWTDCPDGCSFTRTIKKTHTESSQAPSSSYTIDTTKGETITQTIHLVSRTSTEGSLDNGTGSISQVIAPFELPTVEECQAMDGIAVDLNGAQIQDQSCCPSSMSSAGKCSIVSTNTVKDGEPGNSINKNSNLFNKTMDDFNKCLLKNFTDPTDSSGAGGGGGANKKLEVALSFSPKNPNNVPPTATGATDTFAINADEITVESNVDNAKNSEFLNYTWDVFSTSDEKIKDDTPWTALQKSDLDGSGQTIGLGLKNLKFNSRFPDGITFIKVKLTVSENASYNGESGERTGRSEIIIPLSSNQNMLNVYQANIAADSNLTLSKKGTTLSDRICTTNDQNDPVCEVTKNQIVAIEASTNIADPNLAWTIEGQPIENYDKNQEKSDTLTFFPVTKEVGETFNVAFSATDSSGKKINLNRAFKVIDPKITVSSQDESTCVPVLKGFYVDTSDVSWPDYSDTEFETLADATVNLKATFTGSTPPDDKITWYVDNDLQTTPGSSFSFKATKAVGESYSIAVNGKYSQDNNTAKALLEYWGINYNGLYEKDSSAKINVKVVGSLSSDTAKNNVKKFLAALASGVPSYLSFLFRITLTTALLLFAYRVIFTLLPNAKEEAI